MSEKTPSKKGKGGTEDSRSEFRPADESGIPVPSRSRIMDLMVREARPLDLKQIARHFDLDSKQARDALQARLRRMRHSGILMLDRKKRYCLPEKMDLVSGKVMGHPRGYGFVIPEQAGDDLYLHHSQMRRVLHGDTVLAKVKRVDHRGRREGVIVEVMVDREREIIGRFHLEGGIGFVEPEDSRYGRDISIAKGCHNGAKDGDIVVIGIEKHPVEHRHAVGRVVDVLGHELTPGMETEIAIRKHELPHQWPSAVENEAVEYESGVYRPHLSKDRRDIRDLHLVTIDGADARDFDDAVFCQEQNTGWRLVVAIADVSHYVTEGSALDLEALNRGNSVYFPNQVIPMLPEVLSNGLCSLKPDEDRYCMVCDMQVMEDGTVDRYEFYAGMMHSRARLTYERAEEILSGTDTGAEIPGITLGQRLQALYQCSSRLGDKRRLRGSVDFDLPEPLIEFGKNQKINSISRRSRNRAHRLIEECMLAANVCAARFVNENFGERTLYRNHAGPDTDSLIDLRKFLSGLGLQLGGGDNPGAIDFARLLESLSSRQEIKPTVQMVLLRSLSQAEYGAVPAGHFALAFPLYTHFTSPIRRYPDLVVHRQIKSALGVGEPDDRSHHEMMSIGEQCSFTERRADEATWDVIGWLKAEFMVDKVGDVFQGTVSGVRDFGLFVQLDDIFVDGLVHVTDLGGDYYQYDPKHLILTGTRTGQRFRLGQTVKVRVTRVDLDEAKIDFELIGKPREGKAQDKGKKGDKKRRSRRKGKR